MGSDGHPDSYACSDTQPVGQLVIAVDPGCRQPGESPDREFAPVRTTPSTNGIPLAGIKQCSTGYGLEQEVQLVDLIPEELGSCPGKGFRRWKTRITPRNPSTNPCGPTMEHALEYGLNFDEGELTAASQIPYDPLADPSIDKFRIVGVARSSCPEGGWAMRSIPMKSLVEFFLAQIPTAGNPNPPGTTPDQYFVFHMVLGYQTFTVPAGAVKISAEMWGAGGHGDGAESEPYPVDGRGGVGGYTSFEDLAVTPGEQFTIVVGQNLALGTAGVWGFGGVNSPDAHNHSGGGLSGIFTGSGTVVPTDQARAIAIAGGGGAGGADGNGTGLSRGGNGNDPQAGGMPTMQGFNATNDRVYGKGGGGGGYSGGGTIYRNGWGGSGYVKPTVVSNPQVLYADYFAVLPPGTTSAKYADSAGQPDRNGLVVIRVKFA